VIVDVVLGGILGILRSLLELIPEWSPEYSGVTDAAHSIGTYAGAFNDYVPVFALFGVLAFLMGYRLVLIVYRFYTRVYELIPLKAT
jgi:hypothetical protein